MTRLLWIKMIDLGAFIAAWLLLSSGLLITFTLPPKSGQARVLGLTRHDWGDLHFYLAMTFVFLIALHLWLHSAFIVSTVREWMPKTPAPRFALAVLVLAILLGTLLFALGAPVAR